MHMLLPNSNPFKLNFYLGVNLIATIWMMISTLNCWKHEEVTYWATKVIKVTGISLSVTTDPAFSIPYKDKTNYWQLFWLNYWAHSGPSVKFSIPNIVTISTTPPPPSCFQFSSYNKKFLIILKVPSRALHLNFCTSKAS